MSPLAQTLQAAYNGNNEMMTRLLETFDVQNPEDYLPQTQTQTQMAAPGQPAQPGMAPGGIPAAPLGGTAGPSPLAQGPGQIAQLLGLG
jgi:hypothetical protein